MTTRTTGKTSKRSKRAEGTQLAYLPGLDGLRALAVIGVVLYHAGATSMQGGFLGVEVFFVISGYLITSLLLTEWKREGKVGLKHFWLRRARRLLPALYMLVIAVLCYAVVFLPEEVAGLRNDAAAAFSYVTNWYLILAQKSYFEAIGRPSLLQHLWSLAVEEQFYLLFPLAFALILGRLTRRRAFVVVVSAALLSAAWMAFQFQPDTDPSRIYYGTDTRAAGILLGAALAFVWAPWGNSQQAKRFKPWQLDLVGALGVGALLLAFVFLDEFNPFLYQGGMQLVAFFTLAAIAGVVHPRSGFGGKLLGWAPLRWIGLRSYSIYLWHWVVIDVTRPQLDVSLDGAPLIVLRVAATLALAELSYRLIETPFRSRALGRAWKKLTTARGASRLLLQLGWAAATLALLVFGLVLGANVVRAQPPAPPAYLVDEAAPPDAGETEATGAGTPLPEGADQTDLSSLIAMSGDSVEVLLASPEEPGAADAEDLSENAVSTVGDELPPGDQVELSEAPAGEAANADAVSANTANVDVPFAEAPADGWLRRFAEHAGSPVETPADTWLLRLQGPAASIIALPAYPLDNDPDRTTGLRDASAAQALARAALSSSTSAVALAPAFVASTAPPAVSQLALPVSKPPRVAKPAQPTRQVTQRLPPRSGPPRIFAIGDSVMQGAGWVFSRVRNDVEVDALKGRQVSAALEILRARAANERLPDIVIVHMGNNGTFSTRQFDQMMNILANVPHVVFVTLKVPRNWETFNNGVLVNGVARYSNATLVDWHTFSQNHAEWFYQDGIHLPPDGARIYVDFILSSIQSFLPPL